MDTPVPRLSMSCFQLRMVSCGISVIYVLKRRVAWMLFADLPRFQYLSFMKRKIIKTTSRACEHRHRAKVQRWSP